LSSLGGPTEQKKGHGEICRGVPLPLPLSSKMPDNFSAVEENRKKMMSKSSSFFKV